MDVCAHVLNPRDGAGGGGELEESGQPTMLFDLSYASDMTPREFGGASSNEAMAARGYMYNNMLCGLE